MADLYGSTMQVNVNPKVTEEALAGVTVVADEVVVGVGLVVIVVDEVVAVVDLAVTEVDVVVDEGLVVIVVVDEVADVVEVLPGGEPVSWCDV